MRLTSLTVAGFKSFGDRVTVEFSPAVTAIVGPNGSGKSNLLEALRWVGGGGRASAYRAGERSELIFHGAGGKRSLSLAEVELELYDGERSHRVARSLLRDGSGKLRLDGRPARLLDVEERLSGSGLGKGSLAIIGQGEVGQVLMAGPEKLLEHLAEAIGVARLAARREQALARLEAASEQLARLEDLRAELGRQVAALAEEAREAERHAELKREALRLRYTLSTARERGLEREIAGLEQQRLALAAALAAGRAALREVQQGWRAAREAAEGLEARYRARLTEAEVQLGTVRVGEARLEAARERLAALERERETVTAAIAGLVEQAPPSPPAQPLEAAEAAQRAASERLQAVRERLAACERALAAAAERLEERRREQREAEQAEASYRTRLEQLLAQRERLDARLAQLGAPDEAEVAGFERALKAETARRTELAARLESYRARLAEAQQRHADARAEAEARARAAERERAQFEARRGYAQGPRAALSAGLPGVQGAVADLVRVPGELRAALQSALGRRAEYVVVERAEQAEAVIEHVRRAGGWVTVMPLELLSPRRASVRAEVLEAPGVLGSLLERLEVAPRYAALFEQLLGNTVLVEGLAQATEVARRLRERPRLVTLAGDLLEGYGAISGGQARVAGALVGAAADVEEAEAAARQSAARRDEGLSVLQALQQEARAVQAEAEASAAAETERRRELAELREAQRVEASLRAELEQQRRAVDEALAALGASPEATRPEGLEPLEASWRARGQEAFAGRAALERALEAEREARSRLELARERWRQYREAEQQQRAERERVRALARRRGEVEALLSRVREQLARSEVALQEARQAVPTDLETFEAEAAAAKRQSDEAEARLAPLAEAQSQQAEQLEGVKLTLARREAALELAQAERAQFPSGIALLDLGARACRERLAEVEAALEAIGPVNHRAALDLARERERLETLGAQADEARTASDELAAALERIDRETTSRLDTAIQALRRNFLANVRELFGAGAQADIAAYREDGRPRGLAIELQPPGKQTRALGLLSLGERTMGALAFLFSLMQEGEGRGLPVAVLDEVDAPLDEANIRRFCSFVARLAARGTQFVLITHQKATFEIADTLWGVTSDHGVSRVFSIRRDVALEGA